MCGIAGVIDFKTHQDHSASVKKMTGILYNRGPDAEGYWNNGIAYLGHRRLAIIDLQNGAQPMVTKTVNKEDISLAFVGEIYNYKALRQELQSCGMRFTTESDTEVLLKGYEQWGINVVDRLNGMYAFAVWDDTIESLFLVRDRLGIKPLYYSVGKNGVLFGSEPKAILAHGDIQASVDINGFREIFDMVKTPEITYYKDINEVVPGTYIKISREGLHKTTYWALSATAHTDDYNTTVDNVRNILFDAIKMQMVADVPLCTLLSGGLDSSVVTAISKKLNSGKDLHSYSVDFTKNINEFTKDGVRGSPDAPFARELANFTGTIHHEILLNSRDMLHEDVRKNVLLALDGPPAYWGDMWPSLYLLFKELRKSSTVALSGEAADEIFGGYQWFRNPAATNADTFPWLTSGSVRYFGGMQLLSSSFKKAIDTENYRRYSYENAIKNMPSLDENKEEASMRKVNYLALKYFLPTLLERKDRMSMANSLEVRVPFCDHRLVEYVFNVPWSMKYKDNKEKALLKDAAMGLIPESIKNRVKTPYPATQDYFYEKGLITELQSVMKDKTSPIHMMVDHKKINALMQRNDAEISHPYNRGSLELILWVNRWITDYNVNIIM